jgi:hypothetical protein
MQRPNDSRGNLARSARPPAWKLTVAREQLPIVGRRGRAGAIPGSEPAAGSSPGSYTRLGTTGLHISNPAERTNYACVVIGNTTDIAAERMEVMDSVRIVAMQSHGMGVAFDDSPMDARSCPQARCRADVRHA